ncbi:MAG: CPBP family intramembrane metalloprotease [Kiritimatiellae bacterium]|nr:CPBP family intramembrane metalloprotease [Kiritimatiellia bacterium]
MSRTPNERAAAKAAWLAIPAIAAAGMAIAFATERIYAWLGFEWHVQGAVSLLKCNSDDVPAWTQYYLMVRIAAIAPVVEEIVFRWALFGKLLRGRMHMPFLQAAAISATFFAAIHIYMPGVPTLLFLGFAFSWLYSRTGRIASAILCHSLFNIANMVLLLAS